VVAVNDQESAGVPVSGTGQAGDSRDRRAWVGPSPAPARGFVTRSETGQSLENVLVPGATVALVSGTPATLGAPGTRGIRGVPGALEVPGASGQHGTGARTWRDSCGKSQFALSFAQSLWQAGAVDVVIWLTATSQASVLSGYAEAAAALEIQLSGDAESASARLLGWLRDTPRPWLVVLDDLTAAAAGERLRPAGPAGRVLITTADAATAAGYRAHLVPVGPFSRREALNYLIGCLTADLDQRQGAIDLVGELGSEPLALAMASAVIASSELTCHDYREHFVRRREQVIAAAVGGEPAPSAITWALSMDHAELLSPGTAQPLLVLAALLDGNGIPSTVFATTAAREFLAYSAGGGAPQARQTVQDALSALGQAGLLTDGLLTDALLAGGPVAAPPMLHMSWLVQAAVRAAAPERMLKGAAAAAADAVLEAWPADESPEWLARALRSCTTALRQAAGDLLWEGGCHALLLRAGRSLDAARLTGPAVMYWEELAATSTRVLAPGHPATFEINERLARAYLAAGRPAEAISLLRWICDERSRRLGQDHPSAVDARRDLGVALVTAGRYDDAITVLSETASSRERSQGADSIAALAAREDLAAAHRAAGRFADAIALYRRALADRERVQGSRHADTTSTRQKLAEAYLADGQAKAAISQYERVVADRERVLGRDHLHTTAARGALGSAYHAAGRMASAVRLYEQTRAEYAKVLGADHPDTLTACVNLAHAYYGVGRLTDAAKLLAETVDRCELSLSAADPLTVAARNSLANISGPG
jgi:tetratricopeptide (TPR) repeat protein